MIKTLTRHGNSYALVIDKPILELLNINPETPLEISTDGYSLTVAPAQAAASKEEKLAIAKKTMNSKYGAAFKKLAE